MLNLSNKSEQTRDGWNQFLSSRDWQLFITHTFTESVHPEQAEKVLVKFFHRQNVHYYGRKYAKAQTCLLWVSGLERTKLGVIHFHSIVSNVPTDYRFDIAQKHWDAVGTSTGFIKVERVRALNDVLYYVTKYAVKGGEVILSPNINCLTHGLNNNGQKIQTPLL